MNFKEERRRLNKQVVQQHLNKCLCMRGIELLVFFLVLAVATGLLIAITLAVHYIFTIVFGVIALLLFCAWGFMAWLWVKAFFWVRGGRFSIEKDTFLSYDGLTILRYRPFTVGAVFNFPFWQGRHTDAAKYFFAKYGNVVSCYAGLSYISKGMDVYLIVLDGTNEVVAPFFDARFYKTE